MKTVQTSNQVRTFNPTMVIKAQDTGTPSIAIFKNQFFLAYKQDNTIIIKSCDLAKSPLDSNNWEDVTVLAKVKDRTPAQFPVLAAGPDFLFMGTTGVGHTNLTYGASKDGKNWDFAEAGSSGTRNTPVATYVPSQGQFVLAWKYDGGNGDLMHIIPDQNKKVSDWKTIRGEHHLDMGMAGSLTASQSHILMASRYSNSKNIDFIWDFTLKGGIPHMNTNTPPAVAYKTGTNLFYILYSDYKGGASTKIAQLTYGAEPTLYATSDFSLLNQPALVGYDGKLLMAINYKNGIFMAIIE